MSTFKKNLLLDCFDVQSVDDQNCALADQVVVACDSFETRINELLDGRNNLSTDSALQIHADECTTCRQTLQQYEQLELVLGGVQKNIPNVRFERRNDVSSRNDWWRKRNLWLKLSATITLLALLVFMGQSSIDRTTAGVNDNSGLVVPITVATSKSQMISPEIESSLVESTERTMASYEETLLEEMFWMPQGPVGQLGELVVDSGSEFLAAEQEKAAVIYGLSDVRLDMNLVEARLTSLRPMLTYSGRIPALSPMQGTVCFTLGWLKKDKAEGQPELRQVPDSGAELGMRSLTLRDFA